MRPIRQVFLCLAALIAGGIAIFVILYLGSSLQVPARPVATVTYRAASATVQEQTAATSPLQINLDHPLSHLFYLVVIAASRLIGCVLMRFGMPIMVGEMAVGILLPIVDKTSGEAANKNKKGSPHKGSLAWSHAYR